MPVSLRRGRVTAVRERLPGLVRLEVDGDPCIAYPRLTGPVAVGDDVLVNAQARELGLGSGGFDVLHANLTRGLGLPAEPGAHVMTLPYTPLQAATRFAEEDGVEAEQLDGMPVVCCTLHSQVAPVAAALAGLRVAYVQVAGGALPVSLSDAVRELRSRGLVAETVAVAPCFDADLQCASVASALLVARARGAEVAIAAVGPGIFGTGSALRPRRGRSRGRRQRGAERSAGSRCLPSACRRPTRASATAASPTTRAPCSRCRRRRRPGRRACPIRPTGSSPG